MVEAATKEPAAVAKCSLSAKLGPPTGADKAPPRAADARASLKERSNAPSAAAAPAPTSQPHSSLLTLHPTRAPRYADVSPEASGQDVSTGRSRRSRSGRPLPHELAMQLEARRQLLEANPELMERRKALAMAAFVRHDTSEMMDNLHALKRSAHAAHHHHHHHQHQQAAGVNSHPRSTLGHVTNIPPDLLQPSSMHHGSRVQIPGQVYSGLTPGRQEFPFTSTAGVYSHLASTPPGGASQQQQQPQPQQHYHQQPHHVQQDAQVAPPPLKGGSRADFILSYRLQSPAEGKLRDRIDQPAFLQDVLSPKPLKPSPLQLSAPSSPAHLALRAGSPTGSPRGRREDWEDEGDDGALSSPSSPKRVLTAAEASAFMAAHPHLRPANASDSGSAGSNGNAGAKSLHAAYHHAVRAARSALDASSVPATPIALRPETREFTPAVPGTMNGIGHPLLNDPLLLPPMATEPMFVLKHRLRLPPAAWQSADATGSKPVLVPLVVGNIMLPAALPGPSPLPAAKHDDAATAAKAKDKQHATSSSLIPPRERSPPAAPDRASANKPLSEDTLNLWRGKRLNIAEMKIEARLHRLRNNPAAKTELQDRVAALLTAKAEEQAEQLALQLFASERREQKAITFLERQSRYQDGAEGGRKPPILAGVAALFDPRTAEPISDHHPLPAHSTGHWAGFVGLSRMLHALSTCLDAAHWAHAELKTQHAAAARIQAAWRGHTARKLAKSIRARRDHMQRTNKKMALGHTEQSAAHVILEFLQAFDSAGRRGAAAAALKQAVAGVGQEKAKAELVRSMRMAMLVRQWTAVEAAAIEVARKRTRGNAVLGITGAQPTKKPQSMLAGTLAARKRGTMPTMFDDDREARIKAQAEEALSRTFINDRIIPEDCSVVPAPVKAAVVSAYLEHKQAAHVALTGLIWRARAQWKADKRRDDAKRAAANVVAESASATPEPQPQLAALLATASIEPEALPEVSAPSAVDLHRENSVAPSGDGSPTREKSITGNSQWETGSQASKGARGGAAASNPRRLQDRHLNTALRESPTFQRFRILATPMEMKAMMQQGVQEMPSFNAYMLKGKLGEYEIQLTNSLVNNFAKADDKTKKDLVKASKNMQGKNSPMLRLMQAQQGGRTSDAGSKSGGGATAPAAASAHQSSSGNDQVNSFTIALLLHRWKSECMPRARACLLKRYGLLKVDLVDCLTTGKVWTPEEIGVQLQTLVIS